MEKRMKNNDRWVHLSFWVTIFYIIYGPRESYARNTANIEGF